VNQSRPSIATVAFALFLGAQAGAQQPAPRPAGPRTIVGTVFDTLGNVVDSADVRITTIQRRGKPGPNGTFRFDDISPGPYVVSARRFGYLPQAHRVIVGDNGGAVNFALVPYVRSLPPVISAVAQGGLSGVIGDTAYNIVPGAEISVLASDHHATSDSAGRFFMDIKAGNYMVRVKREGFASKLVSVTVPSGEGRRIIVSLTPASRAASAREEWAVTNLQDRLLRRNPVWSKIYTREDMNRLGMTDLTQIATAGASMRVDESCNAILDGGPRSAPIWTLTAAELEYVEVYASRPARNAPTSIIRNGQAPIRGQASPVSDCPATVYAWLRK
jgi:hypothetical protein